jgi:hypothetical protein
MASAKIFQIFLQLVEVIRFLGLLYKKYKYRKFNADIECHGGCSGGGKGFIRCSLLVNMGGAPHTLLFVYTHFFAVPLCAVLRC